MNADQKQTLYTLDFESLIPPPKKYVIDRKELIIRFRLMSIVFPVSYRNTLESKKQTELLDTLLDKTLTLIEYLKIYAITRYKDLLDLQEIEEIEEKEKSDFPFPHYTTQHITIHGHGNVIGNQNTSDVKEVYNPDNKTNE